MPDPNPSATDTDIGFRLLSPVERLLVRCGIAGRFVFPAGLGQVVLQLIAGSGVALDVVTRYTGRLFPETYELRAPTETRYGLRIRAFDPDTNAPETLVRERGNNDFHASKSARAACCSVRKSEPFGRALNRAPAWITGPRADQSAARSTTPFVAYDPSHGLPKADPPLDWTREQTAEVVLAQDISGEAERAGHWYWEGDETRDLTDGRLVRAGA